MVMRRTFCTDPHLPSTGSIEGEPAGADVTRERRRFWRVEQGGGTELLDADFRTYSYARHVHDRYVFGVVTRGAEAFFYRGGRHVAVAGEIVVLNPDEVHDGTGAEMDGWAYRMSYIPLEAFGQKEGGASDPPFFRQPVIRDAWLAKRYHSMHASMAEVSASRLYQDTLFLQVLDALERRHATRQQAEIMSYGESQAIKRVRDHLDVHFSENISVDHLADMVGLRPLYLIKTFHKSVGMPPHAYHIQRRILAAMADLRRGKPIAQAAVDCGFSDQSHLSRNFKKITGVTPGEFRAGSFKKHTTACR